MWLQNMVFLLIAAPFAILYGILTGLSAWAGAGKGYCCLLLAVALPGIDYLMGPSIAGWTKKAR